MSSITLYGISNCDTIKKTRKFLQERDIAYKFHDYRKDGATDALIRKFLQQYSAEELINRRGTTWRALSDAEKALAEGRQVNKLLGKYPALVKRPLLSKGKHWQLGFDPAAMETFIKK